MKRCLKCFKQYEDEFDICPFCGTPDITEPVEPIHLAPGTILLDRYVLGQATGSGGFGIIYKAWDMKLETVVAVKEFFSSRLMTRAAGASEVIINRKSQDEFEYRKDRFLEEARCMAKFGAHRSIPNVFEFFEMNGTAYIVMEFLEGMGLNTMLSQNEGRIDREFAIYITKEVGLALKSLHEKGIIHRDVAPDNIYICSDKDLKVKLIDFGAAKLSNGEDTVVDIILKPGYSPTEQYDNTGAIGPWTDIYALGATLYYMLTGIKPEESTSRKQNDTLIPPNEIDPSIPENLSNTVMKAMAIYKHMRFKNVDDFLKALDGEKKVLTLEKEKRKRKRNQIMGFAVAITALAIGGFFLFNSYKEMEADEYLDKADISIWYMAEAGSDEEKAMKAVVEDFDSKFENVTVSLERYSEKEYYTKLSDAQKNGTLPTLFESSGVSESVLQETITLDNIVESTQAQNCLFLDQYVNYYAEKKQFPLGIEVPLAIVITGGSNQVNFGADSFASLNDFGATKVAFDSEKKDLLSKTWKITEYTEEDFLTKDSGVAVLITTSMRLNAFRDQLLEYEWHCAFPAESANADFIYEWSIAKSDDAEQLAAERLIMWMLGNNYQTELMISYAQNGEIPINKESNASYCSNSKDLGGLANYNTNLVFKK